MPLGEQVLQWDVLGQTKQESIHPNSFRLSYEGTGQTELEWSARVLMIIIRMDI